MAHPLHYSRVRAAMEPTRDRRKGKMKISGTVTWLNEWTGEERVMCVKPFDMPNDAAWVDIVDEAVERTMPAPDRYRPRHWGGDWTPINDNLREG